MGDGSEDSDVSMTNFSSEPSNERASLVPTDPRIEVSCTSNFRVNISNVVSGFLNLNVTGRTGPIFTIWATTHREISCV